MATKGQLKRIDYQNLSPAEKEQLQADYYAIIKTTTGNVSKERFVAFFFGETLMNRIYYTIEEEGILIGFLLFLHKESSFQGKKIRFYNTMMGMAANKQGKGYFNKAILQLFKEFGWKGLSAKGYWISNVVNPISYHGIADVCWRAYPRYERPIPPKLQPILEEYVRLNGKQIVKTADGVKFVGGIPVLLDPSMQTRLDASKKPHILYYLGQGVDYRQGEGLPLIFPLTVANIVLTFLKVLKKNN